VAALVALVVCAVLYIEFGNRDAPDAILRRVMIPLMAMVLVFCAYTQSQLKAFFSSHVSRFLGVISFPLYLLQFQVLISLMSWLVVRDYAAKGQFDHGALIGFACLTVAVTIAAAWGFSQVERAALKALDRYVLRVLI
jgi:peptidoglycan/LPS O-acetylase OafA/YrhL